MSAIIGIIGIASFVNSVLTSVITRKKEFAMLQSIGMTGKQLKRMLSFKGLYYAVGTIITSVIFDVLSSVMVIRGISNGIWFFSYQFVIWPIFIKSKLRNAIKFLKYKSENIQYFCSVRYMVSLPGF